MLWVDEAGAPAARPANQPTIYVIRCAATGQCYVGQSRFPHRRLLSHRHLLRRGTHDNRKLQNAFTKYGEAAFTARVIVAGDFSPELLNSLEWWYMRECDATAALGGFNLAEIYKSSLGTRPPAEVRAAISAGNLKSWEERDGVLLVTICGETRPLRRWAEDYGIKYHTAYSRIVRLGQDPLSALAGPVDRRPELFGVRKTCRQWAEDLGLVKSATTARLRKGWPPSKALLFKEQRGDITVLANVRIRCA